MKNKNLVVSTLLLAIGLVLHALTPGIFGLMKPDFLCAMFFVALTQLDNYQEAMTVSIICAVLAALTTTIPGGQIANGVDKMITGTIVYGLIQIVRGRNDLVKTCVIASVGTILSGTLFLGTLIILGMLPLPFVEMMIVVVLPTVIANSILFYIITRIPLLKR